MKPTKTMTATAARRAAFTVFLLVCGAAVAFAGADFRLRIDMKLFAAAGAGDVSGKVKYDQKDNHRKLEVEMDDVTTAATVEILVDDVSIGTFAVVSGEVNVELNTRDGDSVPVFTCDSEVDVRNAVSLELIATTD